MSSKFLAIGEAMVELAPLANVDEYKLGYAGDTFNTAWYLKRVSPQTQVNFATRVGSDDASTKFLNFMTSSNLGTEFISQCDVRSMGLYMISLNNGERSFSYWRSQSAAREIIKNISLLRKAMIEHDVIYFSGISLAILDPASRATLLDLLADARANGAMVAFDSNLRPKLWENTNEMCEWVMKAAAVSDVILPSFDDEAYYFDDANPKATLDRYLKAGAKTVVVKNGDGHILYAHEGVEGNFIPQKVDDIIDTTAAGDSFNGGFFANFGKGCDIEKCLEQACALAAKVIQRRGALVELDQ